MKLLKLCNNLVWRAAFREVSSISLCLDIYIYIYIRIIRGLFTDVLYEGWECSLV